MSDALPRRLRVPAGHGRTFVVKAGQTVKVVDAEGQQAADFVAVREDDVHEKLSPVHTRRALKSLFFQVGDTLVSNHGRPMLRVLADTVGVHDANVPACDDTRFTVDFNVEGHRNCVANLHEGMAFYGIAPDTVPDPFNLFQNGPVTPDGRMRVTDPTSVAGDHITLLALCDLVCAVSACPQDIIPGNGLRVTPIDIEVAGPAGPADAPSASRQAL
ncbi:amino acid--ACP ligase [Rhodoferax koreense]|uniref:Amino acid--ACP ligase n=2 Tax=Rhodoferax koreensis TaxID=1842727 RepID=A0A1P8K4E4_9BURK|nr:amino acid--ACP ligase [Rhodoferax koreense]